MPMIEVSSGIHIHYEEDDYADAWSKPDCVLMLHGICETGIAFRAWAPFFARRYRVIRPDLRGFGKSSPLGVHTPKDVGIWADDIDSLMNTLERSRVHVIGAKLGALVAMELAQRHASWMASMTLAGLLLSPKKAVGPMLKEWTQHIDEKGLESWVRVTMPGRMGSALSREANEWWIKQMADSPVETLKACLRMIANTDEPARLEDIRVPTLVIVSAGKATSEKFEQRQSLDAVEKFCRRIPQSELMQIEASSYHVAATHPDECAIGTRRFIEERAQGTP